MNAKALVPVLAASLMAGCAGDSHLFPVADVAGGNTKPAMTLVDGTRTNLPPAPIFVRPGAPGEEMRAATELARYLSLISGAKFAVQTATTNLPPRAVLVGPVDAAMPADFPADGYVIRARDGRLHIAGGSPRGTMYGVYGFLEDILGCRWWSWNEEHVPSNAVLRLRELDIVMHPPFSMHDLYNKEAQNTGSNFPYKCRGTSWEKFSGGHTLCPLLKPYAETNKDFLPMNSKGVRAFNDLHMDYSAAGMSEALADALGKQVEANGRNVSNIIYFAGMGDWYGGMCECPACKAVYEEETWTDPDGVKKPGYIATLIRMLNKTAEILDKKYPGIRVGTFAYMSLEAPPAKTKPRDNVVIWIPRLRHDTVLSIAESEKNKSFLRNTEQWCKLAPGRTYIWEYGANFNNFLYPFPCLRSMAENIRLYHKMGIRGIMIQGDYVSTGSDMVVLKNYVWRKMMWNPALDTDQLVREFCQGYYGPAAPEMIEYVNTLEDSVRKPVQIHADEFSDALKTYLTPALSAQLRQILARAVAKTPGNDGDACYRRVREAMASIEAAALCSAGPVAERDGKLVRTDLNEYTFPRARDLVRYMRDAGPREWGTGRAWRMSFLSTHGGPLFKLAQGPVEVKVAPSVNGQVWRVSFNGQAIVENAVENLSLGASYYASLTQSAANVVSMEAELGLGNWSENTKQIARKTVAVDPDGAIRITGIGREAVGPTCATAEVLTPYLPGTNTDGVAVEVSPDNSQWQKIAWAPDKPEVVLPAGLKALRVSLPAKGCIVTDEYLSPKVTGAKLLYNSTNATLTTSVTLDAVAIPAGQKEAVYMDRTIRIEPAGK